MHQLLVKQYQRSASMITIMPLQEYEEEIVALIRISGKLQKIQIEQANFSTITNAGHNVGQTVLHFHLLVGKKLNWEATLSKQLD